jgi:hypothetical protein
MQAIFRMPLMDRFPVRDAADVIELQAESEICDVCNEALEDTGHPLRANIFILHQVLEARGMLHPPPPIFYGRLEMEGIIVL